VPTFPKVVRAAITMLVNAIDSSVRLVGLTQLRAIVRDPLSSPIIAERCSRQIRLLGASQALSPPA
jgi:hypothetical protein